MTLYGVNKPQQIKEKIHDNTIFWILENTSTVDIPFAFAEWLTSS